MKHLERTGIFWWGLRYIGEEIADSFPLYPHIHTRSLRIPTPSSATFLCGLWPKHVTPEGSECNVLRFPLHWPFRYTTWRLPRKLKDRTTVWQFLTIPQFDKFHCSHLREYFLEVTQQVTKYRLNQTNNAIYQHRRVTFSLWYNSKLLATRWLSGREIQPHKGRRVSPCAVQDIVAFLRLSRIQANTGPLHYRCKIVITVETAHFET
jgi:hypothetical protein